MAKRIMWNYELAKPIAMNNNSLTEFQKNHSSLHRWILKNKFKDELLGHMKGRFLWNLELVKLEAVKYDTLIDFQKGSSSAYSWALRNKRIKEISLHMKGRSLWSLKLVKIEALKYDTLIDFQKGSSGAYQWALKNKKIKDVSLHMKKNLKEISLYMKKKHSNGTWVPKRIIINWSFELVKEEALKYTKLRDFMRKSSGAYAYSLRHNLLKQICTHMIVIHRKYTDNEAIEISKKYETIVDLKEENASVYSYLVRKNLLKEGTRHMTRLKGGFNPNKRGTVYYIRIDKDGDTVYKIGITNRTIEERFITQIKYITPIYSWKFKNGYDAIKLEKEILNDYSYAKYKGPNILISGNTEMFIDDVLMLDKEIA